MELKDFLLSYFSSGHYQQERVSEMAESFGLKGKDQLEFYDLIDEMLEDGQVKTNQRGEILPIQEGDHGEDHGKDQVGKNQLGPGQADQGQVQADQARVKEEKEEPGEEADEDLLWENDVESLTAEDQAYYDDLGTMSAADLDESYFEDQGENEDADPMEGQLSGNAKGFAFFISDNPNQEDVFIDPDHLGKGLNGDRVRIKIIKEGDPDEGLKPEGEVLEVLDRSDSPFIGSYEKFSDFGFVVSDNQKNFKDVYIDSSQSMGAQDGDQVVAQIDKFDQDEDNPEGHVVEVLGKVGGQGVDISSVVRAFELPTEFSEESLEEADRLPDHVRSKEMVGRKDLRSLFTVTIDGADAKDFDDAISAEKKGRFYNLYVHIADVSHYVRPGSSIDRDAFERGNSVYLLDRVIPMLPEKLSNGICSLNPGEDRLAMTTQMVLDDQGHLMDYQVFPSVIKSDRRLVYKDVSDFLEGGSAYEDDQVLRTHLKTMEKIYKSLAAKREKRGTLDFDLPETKIKLNEDGVATDVEEEERRVANRIIEEFMILNNEVVGNHFFSKNLPFIYRIHDKPLKTDIDCFNEVLYAFGYPALAEDSKPEDFQKILEKAKGSPEESVLNMLCLRTMQKAEYSPKPIGHFGLASDHYSHFTAPIRRYGDLIAHRLVKAYLAGKPRTGEMIQHRLLVQCQHISDTEQIAEEAERDAIDMKSAEYMQQFIGDYFDGEVSSLTKFGIFVKLENTVEGLVHYRTMHDDYYTYDEKHFVVTGERTHKKIRYGDKVKVQVIGADPLQRNIDFRLVDKQGWPSQTRKKRKGKQTQPTPSHARGSKKSKAFRRQREWGRKGAKPSRSNKKTARKKKKRSRRRK